MGIGEHFLIFHHHHHHHHHHKMKEDDGMMKIQKGCMAVMVGHEDEEKKRFIIPVMYLNHPLFMELLKKAELEYGYHNQGPINIPCHVKHFCNIQAMIHQDLQQHHHNTIFSASKIDQYGSTLDLYSSNHPVILLNM